MVMVVAVMVVAVVMAVMMVAVVSMVGPGRVGNRQRQQHHTRQQQ
jgi:NADH:ubiquinone oxidoreductase subunit 3 (subunit A)